MSTKIYKGNCPMSLMNNNIPGSTLIAIPEALRWNNVAKNPPAAPPTNPQTNGLKYLKFTPNIAGSVIPKKAENAEGKAKAFNFF